MRQMPHFLTKIPVSRQIRLVFWGRKWQFSFAEKSVKYFRTMKKNRKSAKFERIFPQKKCRFRPRKTSRIQREFGFFSKNVALFSSGGDNSPVGTTTSGISRLLQRNCSLRMRKRPHFLNKIPIFSSNWGSEIGSKYANFSDFWALLPDPEITSLHPTERSIHYLATDCT